jgi:membrane-bound lytic murein transglycosylase D
VKIKYLLYGIGIGLVPLAYVMFFSSSSKILRLEATSFSDSAGIFFKSVTSVTPPNAAYLFGKKIPLENWEVRERFEREFYYNYVNCDQLILWYKRLKRWEKMIDSSLDANNLDRDLKYLMVAESGVRNVESPAKANGFWQFIPPTGQRWGLRVDESIDERLDPVKATSAAMKYLTKLKNQFASDYFLAVASFNMSEDNVESVLDYQHQSSYWNIFVNEETMRYVLRIAVIKELLEHGSRYGLRFESVAPYLPWNINYLSVTGPIESIADWAKTNGYSYKDIKIYNPWLIARSIPQGQFQIAVPATNEARTTVVP